MWILAVILSGFFAATLAPAATARLGRGAGFVLAALPACLFGCFALVLLDAWPMPGRLSVPWVPGLGLRLSFQSDGLAALFALLITGIGALVLVYAAGYLPSHNPADRRRAGRFYAFVLCFMASMLGLVLADNVLVLYLFWEATGITSFLLIGTDHERPAARAAAWQALLVTGAGGLALLAGVLLLAMAGGTFELSELAERGEILRPSPIYVPALLLVLAGAFTKSAQFPFHFWLPSAMEAPTPVSAYLHSATMVKAGVYLLARLVPALGGTAAWHWGVIPVGAVTALVGGYLAIHVSDLKRVLAYSTVSALGTMVLLLGVGTEGAVKAAVVLVVAHALYKGALFMVVGAIDHETGTRELDELGGLRRAMPITAAAAVLAALSLAGLFPMLSFVAKELLLEAVWTWPSAARVALAAVAVLGGAMFVVVAWVVGVRPFFGTFRVPSSDRHVHEPPPTLWLGPAVLAAAGMIFGLIPGALDQIVAPAASAALGRAVEVHLALWHGVGMPLLLSLASIALGVAMYTGWVRLRRTNPLLERLVGWGPAIWYEGLVAGMNAAARMQTRLLQSGYLRYYLLITVAAAVVLVGVPLAWRVEWSPPASPAGWRFYEVALAALAFLGAAAAVRARSRIAAVTALGVVGYAIGLLFLLFGAPDLAMTQFLVETLIVILFVLVFRLLPPPSRLSSHRERVRDAALAVCAGALVTGLTIMASGVALDRRVSDFFTENSLPGGHGRNVVNVILVDFRALDTLGEITVLAIAGLGIYALLRLRPSLRPQPQVIPYDAPEAAPPQAVTAPRPNDGDAAFVAGARSGGVAP